MSLLTQSSPKHCANKGFHLKNLLLNNKKLVYGLSTFISSILFIILLLCLILHPTSPSFHLQDTVVSGLALSSPHLTLLNSTIQTTLVATNPNTRLGIYYDNLRVYAIYRGQQITGDSMLPSFYQGHEETSVLSAELHGTDMPVAASVGYEVGRDQVAGRLALSVRIDGQLRWRVGGWVSGKYQFDVDCVAVVGLGPGGNSSAAGGPQGTQCSTNI